jgi:hypothetical protein
VFYIPNSKLSVIARYEAIPNSTGGIGLAALLIGDCFVPRNDERKKQAQLLVSDQRNPVRHLGLIKKLRNKNYLAKNLLN